MITKVDKNKARLKRHLRVRKKIQGTAERPRLNIFRSSKHMYAQLIDDVKGVTLASASTQDKELREGIRNGGNIEAATKVGALIAERAKKKSVSIKWFSTAADICITVVSKHLQTLLVKQVLNSNLNLHIRR